jgi:hypothetical protein
MSYYILLAYQKFMKIWQNMNDTCSWTLKLILKNMEIPAVVVGGAYY